MAAPEGITSYRWDGSATIRQVDVRTQGADRAVAYLYANENEQQGSPKLQALRSAFREHGWASSSDIRDGKPVLRLTGLPNAEALLTLLQTQHAIEGAPHTTTQTANDNAPHGLLDATLKNSLRASGIFYTIGNLLFIMSGVARKDNAQLGTGLSFTAGDALLTAFGGKDDARQFKSLLIKLKDHLDERGIAIPEHAALNAEVMAGHSGFLETCYDFTHRHINIFKIIAEVLGGGLYFKAGINQNNPRKQAAGAVIVAGWLAAGLIREKKADKDELANAGSLEKTAAYIQEKPLRLAGWSGLTHNALSSIGAYEEHQKQRALPGGGTSHHYWDIAGIAAMLLGNSLYAISNKTTGGSITNDDLTEDVYGLAAQVLNRQPPAVRDAAIQATADFLGERTEIKDTRSQVVARLTKEMETLSHNPWFDKSGNLGLDVAQGR